VVEADVLELVVDHILDRSLETACREPGDSPDIDVHVFHAGVLGVEKDVAGDLGRHVQPQHRVQAARRRWAVRVETDLEAGDGSVLLVQEAARSRGSLALVQGDRSRLASVQLRLEIVQLRLELIGQGWAGLHLPVAAVAFAGVACECRRQDDDRQHNHEPHRSADGHQNDPDRAEEHDRLP
jgi:hypothetical protein